MSGWMADFLRFIWGLLYWNTRKSVFRWWGGHCPCQHPSDSGRAYETACIACATWHKPARFRRVCPLLVETPEGLRCSADTRDVRPFWGRAMGFYGGGIAALWLAAALAIFAVMRSIGYPVSLVSVAWPPAWRQIRAARAEYFFQKARHALDVGQIGEALLALPYAYALDPHDYSAGLLLARLYGAGSQPVLSDRLYAQLMREHPEQHALTAAAWHQTLLLRGDFAKLSQLSAQLLASQPPPAPDWLGVLFFASRHTGDAAPLHMLLDKPGALPADWRELVQIELLIDQGRTDEARTALRRLNTANFPYAAYYQIQSLTRLGFSSDAIVALRSNRRFLGLADQIALTLDAFAAEGWSSLVRSETENAFLAQPRNVVLFEVLGTHLIRHPDAELLAFCLDKLAHEPPPRRDEAYHAALALFCAAGVSGDWSSLRAARLLMRNAQPDGSIAVLNLAEAFFRGKSVQQRIESILPVLQPLSFDADIALLDHYDKNQPDQRAP